MGIFCSIIREEIYKVAAQEREVVGHIYICIRTREEKRWLESTSVTG